MEDAVVQIMNLASGVLSWGVNNALPLAVGAVVGGRLIGTAAGLVGDLLGRAKEAVVAVGDAASGK